MDREPLLSVIIPVYNAEETLPQRLDSVLAQSLAALEVICVDDGSTDGSLTILREYEERDPRVRVLSQQHQHAGAARNAGLVAARGVYVHFLDAGDTVLPYAYECVVRKMEKHGLDMLRFAAVDYDLERGVYVDDPRDTLSGLRPGDFMRLVGTEAGSPLFKVGVVPRTSVYRREFLSDQGIRFASLPCANGRSFAAAALTNARRIMVSCDRVVLHRVSSDGSSVDGHELDLDCHLRSLEQVIGRLDADGVELEVQERVLLAEFADLFEWFVRLGSLPEGGEPVREQMEAFVAEYHGPCTLELHRRHRDALKRLAASPAPPAKPARQVTVFHEACAHPKVSVAVPTYNVEDYLNVALNSLTCQELEEMEFLCVNDGSTDGSLAILCEYAALDARFRILDGPNGGYGRAMNRAMDAARGEYLGILEPDDFVPANMFRELYQAASKNDVDLVKADFNRFKVNADGSLNSKRFRLTNDASYYNRVLRPLDERESFWFVMNTWSGIYKLDFLRRWNIRHNETPGASYQDNGFWFQTFCRAERAYFVNKPYYMNRRDNPNSSMFSSGKMYAVTNEYRFIQELLEPDVALWEQVEDIFYAKKLSNFFVTLYRLAPEFQREYVHHLKEEFDEPYARGIVDGVRSGAQLRFQEIMADPDAYLNRLCVSVIVPVYNAERYVGQLLDSLLVRNQVQFEVICVDDGSTDGSLTILREYEARDPRVRVITQANVGAGAARNAGMALARGEYLSFLDADDFFEPEMLRMAYDRAHRLDADIVVFRSDEYHEDTGKFVGASWTIHENLLPPEQPFGGTDVPMDVFKVFNGWPWDKLFRAEFVRENGLAFQNLRTSNDALFVFSAIVRAERISTINTVLAHHRKASGTLSVTREQSWGCFYEALCALRQQLRGWGLYERFEQDFINYSLHFSLWHLNSLRGQAYHLLYARLKDEWFADLGILSHGMDYFYYRNEWDQLQQILELDDDEYLSWRVADLNAQLAGQRAETASLKEQLTAERRRTRQLTAENKKLKDANKKLTASNKKLQAQVKRYRTSPSWKVGRAITWLPRKLRALLKRLKLGHGA